MKKKVLRFVFPSVFLLSIHTLYAEEVKPDLIKGEKIFQSLCIHCHKLNYDDKFGPGLAGILERRDAAWLHEFLKDPAKVIREDEYAQSLRESNEYNLTMPAFKEMQDRMAREAIIAYLGTLE